VLRKRSLTLSGLVPFLLVACSNAPEQPARSNVPKVQSASVVPAVERPEVAPEAPPEPEPAEPATKGDDVMRFASLAPSGSFLWLQASSLDDLIAVGNQFSFWGGEGMDLEQGLKLFPVAGVVEHIDRSQPIGLAVGFVEGSQTPGTTLVLPVTDRARVIQAFRASSEELEVFGLDEYVVASTLPEYVPGTGDSKLTTDLPEGQIVARVDVPVLLEGLGPMVTSGLSQMKGQIDLPADAGGAGNEVEREMRLALIEGIETALQSAASLDLVLSQAGDEVDVSLAFVASEGSELDGLLPAGSGNLRDLARCVDDEADFAVLTSVDSETLAKKVLPLWSSALDNASAQNGGMDPVAREWLDEFSRLWPLCGDALVACGDVHDGGLRLAYYFRPDDHEAFAAELTKAFASFGESVPGLRIDGPADLPSEKSFVLTAAEAAEGINLADITRHEESLRKLFGTSEVHIRMAEHEGTTVLTIGGDEGYLGESRERLDRAPEEVPAHVAAGLEALGDANPAFVMQLDLVDFMSEFADLLAEQSENSGLKAWSGLADEAPLPVVYYGGVDGLVWQIGVRVDFVRLGEVMRKAGR